MTINACRDCQMLTSTCFTNITWGDDKTDQFSIDHMAAAPQAQETYLRFQACVLVLQAS